MPVVVFCGLDIDISRHMQAEWPRHQLRQNFGLPHSQCVTKHSGYCTALTALPLTVLHFAHPLTAVLLYGVRTTMHKLIPSSYKHNYIDLIS